MQRRLEDYVMIFRGVIPEDLRLQTLELLKDENLWVKHYI
jgi:hypothetical protein